MGKDHNFKDEVGKKFGRLEVQSEHSRDSRGRARWLCKCDCGTEKSVAGYKLRSGETRSCGCLRRETSGNLTRLSSEELERRKTEPRQCTKCGNIYPPSEFKHLCHHHCKGCVAEYHRKRMQGQHRRVALRDKYGVTLEQYDLMLKEQAGVCAICKLPPSNGKFLHVDHDHDTGVVRGLLCNGCNVGIGGLKDSVELLSSAASYLTSRVNTIN